MAIALSDDARKQALASIRRYCGENLDAQVFLRDRLADLEATCYEPEFVYWPKPSSVRRK
jgi:hypothetical protein